MWKQQIIIPSRMMKLQVLIYKQKVGHHACIRISSRNGFKFQFWSPLKGWLKRLILQIWLEFSFKHYWLLVVWQLNHYPLSSFDPTIWKFFRMLRLELCDKFNWIMLLTCKESTTYWPIELVLLCKFCWSWTWFVGWKFCSKLYILLQ